MTESITLERYVKKNEPRMTSVGVPAFNLLSQAPPPSRPGESLTSIPYFKAFLS